MKRIKKISLLLCHACGKPIEGEYVKALESVWHPECFRCAACDKPITTGTYLDKQGKPYHPDCYHEKFSPRCSGCGKPIEGPYIRALNKFWHPEHFVCAHCGTPLKERFHSHRGKPYCDRDYLLLFAEKCALCGQPLVEKYTIDVWGNKYCLRHEGDPRCTVCDRFIGQFHTGGGVRYADGREICQECHSKAVTEVSDAYALLDEVKKLLKKYDINFDKKLKIRLKLVGQKELQETIPRKRKNSSATGVTQTEIETIFGAERSRGIKEIKVLYGLPSEYLGAVLAHEMIHTWLFLNRFPELPKKISEGLCELFASYWLEKQESDLAKVRLEMLEKNPDRVYGRGYRVVRKAVEKTSLAYVLDHLLRYGVLPEKP